MGGRRLERERVQLLLQMLLSQSAPYSSPASISSPASAPPQAQPHPGYMPFWLAALAYSVAKMASSGVGLPANLRLAGGKNAGQAQAMFGRPRQASSSPQKLHTTALLESAPKGSPTHYSLRHLAPPVEVAEGGDAAGRVGGQVGPAGGEILGEEEIVGARGAAAVEQKAEESRGKGVACVGRELINQ